MRCCSMTKLVAAVTAREAEGLPYCQAAPGREAEGLPYSNVAPGAKGCQRKPDAIR